MEYRYISEEQVEYILSNCSSEFRDEFVNQINAAFVIENGATYRFEPLLDTFYPVQIKVYTLNYSKVRETDDKYYYEIRVGSPEDYESGESPGIDPTEGQEEESKEPSTIYAYVTQEEINNSVDIPNNPLYSLPEGSLELKIDKISGDCIHYSISILSNEDGNFELGIEKDQNSSSSGDLGYRLPSVNEGTDADGEGETAGENGGYSQPSSCICDTLGPVNVNGSYQFKLTSTDGSTPTVTVSGGSFHVGELVRDGNDYYVKVCAVGGVNTTGDVYVNGTRVATLKVLYPYGGVSSDTTAPFTVRQGETYQFRLTSDTMPSMTAGSPSFVVEYAGSIGRDWFFKVRAVGEAGDGCGFYVNGAPFPVAIAHITAKES